MKNSNFSRRFLLFTTLIVGMCSLIYELLISTVSSYFLGDSVRQFSIIIGCYLASMGLGSWLTRYVKKSPIYAFVLIEICLGIVGAFSVPLCYIYFSFADFTGFQFFVLFIIMIIGVLTGMEVPILTQILNDDELKISNNLSDVLTLDYLGALVATLLFPFFLIPFLGVYKSSLLFGFINISIGVLTFLFFNKKINIPKWRKQVWTLLGISSIGIITLAFAKSNQFINNWNKNVFKYPVIHQEASEFQQIVLTKDLNEFRLYLNGAIQFSSKDEYRYHEALVHVGAQQIVNMKNVLILGGGEGLAAREVLKYPSVESIDIVDLDPRITELASTLPVFLEQNKKALLSHKVHVHNDDAFHWLMNDKKEYDYIIVDLPDPSNETLSRLYSMTFYTLCKNRLRPDGLIITQATSPELATNAFWCIDKTMRETGFSYTYPFHVSVPSFGDWGYVIGSKSEIDFRVRKYIDMKLISNDFLEHCFYFPKDIRSGDIEVNQLDKPILMEYYLDHWHSLQAEKR